jgi:hypothetical protein
MKIPSLDELCIYLVEKVTMHTHKRPNIFVAKKTRLADRPKRRRHGFAASITTLLVVVLLVLAGPALTLEPAQAQQACERSGKSGECQPWGEAWMPNRAEMRGDPVELTAEIYLTSDFQDLGARWVMFSVRNVTWDGTNPIDVRIDSFGTQYGTVITTREDYQPHQVDLWVDVMDLPVNDLIEIDMTINSAAKGAFLIETMIIVFDRGYEEIKTSGGDNVALFAATHLGVHEESGSGSGGLSSRLQNVPGPGLIAVVAALGLVAAVFHGRRKA